MKLSPNVTDITEMARAAEAGGADAISLINTLTGMKIDVKKRTFAVQNKTAGVSGPAIHPIAVRMVYQVANAVKLPIIGMGGIATTEDALEMIMAGATAIAVGTANFNNPYATVMIEEGIEQYLMENHICDIKRTDWLCKGIAAVKTDGNEICQVTVSEKWRGKSTGKEVYWGGIFVNMDNRYEEIVYSRYKVRVNDMAILEVDEGFEKILGFYSGRRTGTESERSGYYIRGRLGRLLQDCLFKDGKQRGGLSGTPAAEEKRRSYICILLWMGFAYRCQWRYLWRCVNYRHHKDEEYAGTAEKSGRN